MAYFKLNNVDYSQYVSGLTVIDTKRQRKYDTPQGTFIDYIGSKAEIRVKFVPMAPNVAAAILAAGEDMCAIQYLDPKSNTMRTVENCWLDEKSAHYYRIDGAKTLCDTFTLTFEEL